MSHQSQDIQIDVRIFEGKMPPIDEMIQTISRPDCGGISVFQGITRDNFKGKKVSKLSYQCYDKMALKEMQKIAQEAVD